MNWKKLITGAVVFYFCMIVFGSLPAKVGATATDGCNHSPDDYCVGTRVLGTPKDGCNGPFDGTGGAHYWTQKYANATVNCNITTTNCTYTGIIKDDVCNVRTGFVSKNEWVPVSGNCCYNAGSGGGGCDAAGTCPTVCHTDTQTVPDGSCGTTSCPSNAPAAGTCPTVCHTDTQTVPDGSCGTTSCPSNVPAAGSCPTNLCYAGSSNTIPDGSCGYQNCPAIPCSAPTIVSASPPVISFSGPASLTIVTRDLDGASDIERVYFALNNCSVDPGSASWSSFEHNNANFFGVMTYGGSNINVANNNTGAACTGAGGAPNPWGVVAPFVNAVNTLTTNSVSDSRSGNDWTSTFNVTLTNFPGGTYNYYGMVRDNEGLWHIGGPSWKKMGTVCVEGGAVPSAWSGWSATCGTGTRTRTCTENCGTDNCSAFFASKVGCDVAANCSYVGNTQTETRCVHCAPTVGDWGACDANHRRSRVCTENDGLCDGNDCDAYFATDCPNGACIVVGNTQSDNCIGTITGTLFDASDIDTSISCPDDFSTLIRYGSEPFGITGPWPAINPPVETIANGTFSENVYASGIYGFNFDELISSGRASAVKTECGPAMVDVLTQVPVVKNTGFWRVYGGWWQTVGGNVYAKSGIKSTIPASVIQAGNQRLILADATGKSGMLSYGVPWTGAELGTNPNAKVSTPGWMIQSIYDSLRYDYSFYNTRMDVFTSTAWDGGAVNYTDTTKGYQIFKRTGNVNLSYGGPTGTQKVILLVDGSVTINSNVTVPPGAFLIIIASGNITFGSDVANAEGWFVAETINISCKDTAAPIGTCDKTDIQFGGEGSFVGWTKINLGRVGVQNNLSPSELFTYRTDMLLNAPAPVRVYTKKFSPFIP